MLHVYVDVEGAYNSCVVCSVVVNPAPSVPDWGACWLLQLQVDVDISNVSCVYLLCVHLLLAKVFLVPEYQLLPFRVTADIAHTSCVIARSVVQLVLMMM